MMAAPAGKPCGQQPKVMVVEGAEVPELTTGRDQSLSHSAQQNQQVSVKNKELFQDHTSLTATLASSMDPTGCI